MKNTLKIIGIIAFVTVIGFSFGACGDDNDNTGGGGDTAINIAAIPGVTAPVTGEAPVTTITDTAQYTGTVAWNGSPATFAAGTVYTATITLTAKTGFTLTGVAANFFTVAGANPVTNAANSGAVTAVFPATGSGGNSTSIEMVQIQDGTFQMGSPTNEPNHDSEETQHSVTLTGFYMGKYPVTQAQYEAVMGNNPSYFKTPVPPETRTANRPVEMVTWYDAVEFCNKLSTQEGLAAVYTITSRTPATGYPITAATVAADWSKNGYRLPTEAQWEYACRAGTATPFNTGNNITTDQANYNGNYSYIGNPAGVYLQRTTEVGSYAANAWGLYDMHGNVYEWCWDWYGTYSSEAQEDPTGAVSGNYRVRRGGSWDGYGRHLRSAYRNFSGPSIRGSHIGFRLVRPAQ